MLSDDKFLALVNQAWRDSKVIQSDVVDIVDIATVIKDSGMDSLDFIMVAIIMAETYGVADETAKAFTPTTMAEFRALLEQHKTKDPEA